MVTPTAQTSITVSWDTDTAVATYKLERAIAVTPTATPAWTQVAVVTPAPSSTTTSYPDPSRSCGTAYLYRVSAIGDGTNYSKFEYGDPSQPEPASTDYYCTPQDLTIIPMPQRKAELCWGAVNGATYTVQVRKPSGNWPTPIPGGTVPNEQDKGTSTSYEIKLDEVFNAGTVAAPTPEGLAHATAYQLRVRAKVAGKDYYSKTITLRDSPIVRVNGHSPGTGANTGKAVVTWKPPSGATAYYVRWRKLGRDKDSNLHTSPNWQLDSKSLSATAFDGTPTPTPLAVPSPSPIPADQTVEHEIMGLERGTLYAIQLNFLTDDGWVFSARDAYVWPSGAILAPGKKVAGYPTFGHFASKTYKYRICKSTFPLGEEDAWALLIEDALMRWQKATNGFITMMPEHSSTHTPSSPQYKPCSNLSVPLFLVSVMFSANPDNALSEIRMIDPPNDLAGLSSMREMIFDPYKLCILRSAACVTSVSGYTTLHNPIVGGEVPSADITFNQDAEGENRSNTNDS